MAELIKIDMTDIWASGGDKVAPTSTKIAQGWIVEAVPRQTWNWFENRQDNNIAYLLQKGFPEWDVYTEYQANKSFVQYNGIVYKCTVTSVNRTPDTNPTYWTRAFADYSASMNALRAVTPAANTLPYFTSTTAAATTTLSAFARTILDDADAGAVRNTIGAQQAAANLTALAGLTSSNNLLPYFTGSGTAATTTLSGFGRTLIDDADAEAARNTLGLVKTASKTDLTSGRMMKVGDFGLGAGYQDFAQDCTDCNTVRFTGWTRLMSGCANAPSGFSQGATMMTTTWNNGTIQQVVFFGKRQWQRQMSGLDNWEAWVEFAKTSDVEASKMQFTNGLGFFTGNTTLTASNSGSAWQFAVDGLTITLPAASAVGNGGTITFRNPRDATQTILPASGDLIVDVASGSSLVMAPLEYVMLVCRSNVWYIVSRGNLYSVADSLAKFGLGHNNTAPGASTVAGQATLPSGNYYFPDTTSPYPAFAWVQRLTYQGNRGFEIANIPYSDRLFLRGSNQDGTWRSPVEIAKTWSPTFGGIPTAPTASALTSTDQLATTSFVTQSMRGFKGAGYSVAANYTIPATGMGSQYRCIGTGKYTITLPDPGSVVNGSTVLIRGECAGGFIVTTPSGKIYTSYRGSGETHTFKSNEWVEIINSNSDWSIIGRGRLSETVEADSPEFTGTPVVRGLDVARYINSGSATAPALISRIDGGAFYFLLTNASDQTGSFNSLRPFTLNLTSGRVDMASGATVASPSAGDRSNRVPTTSWVGTELANNTSSKADLNSPVFTGSPQAPTQSVGNSSTSIATTAFVQSAIRKFGLGTNGTNSVDITDLNSITETGLYRCASSAANLPVTSYGLIIHQMLNTETATQVFISTAQDRMFTRRRSSTGWTAWAESAYLDSPAFTGTPTAPTAATGTNTTQVATTAFVKSALDSVTSVDYASRAGTATTATSATSATTASRWATARTLTYTGDMSGSTSIDGSSNVNVNITLNTATFSSFLAGQGTGTPGSYALMALGGNTIKGPGDTIAGAQCRFSSADGNVSTAIPNGTWRVMGNVAAADLSGSRTVTLCLRIS